MGFRPFHNLENYTLGLIKVVKKNIRHLDFKTRKLQWDIKISTLFHVKAFTGLYNAKMTTMILSRMISTNIENATIVYNQTKKFDSLDQIHEIYVQDKTTRRVIFCEFHKKTFNIGPSDTYSSLKILYSQAND